ncbi:hypothetical protein F5Y17DRAFT_156743 [Xylariaceae sp. FL0594]|nr:hypothetical protein F5Y17DRAFT_156743 [Xylariaceae sp. FL0594]
MDSTFRHTQIDLVSNSGSSTKKFEHAGISSPKKLVKRSLFKEGEDDTRPHEKRLKIEKPTPALRRQWGPPQERYTMEYQVRLAGLVTLAVQKTRPFTCVIIKEFPIKKAEETLYWCRRLRHNNIITALETFSTDNILYIAFEEMDATLGALVACPAYPNENQLGAILGQLLDALVYIKNELVHSRLDCDQVVLNKSGSVKIMAHEYRERALGGSEDADTLKDLRCIILRLMYKSTSEPAVTVQGRWPKESKGYKFYVALGSVKSVLDLRQHGLVQGERKKGLLQGLVRLTMVSIKPEYSVGLV